MTELEFLQAIIKRANIKAGSAIYPKELKDWFNDHTTQGLSISIETKHDREPDLKSAGATLKTFSSIKQFSTGRYPVNFSFSFDITLEMMATEQDEYKNLLFTHEQNKLIEKIDENIFKDYDLFVGGIAKVKRAFGDFLITSSRRPKLEEKNQGLKQTSHYTANIVLSWSNKEVFDELLKQ